MTTATASDGLLPPSERHLVAQRKLIARVRTQGAWASVLMFLLALDLACILVFGLRGVAIAATSLPQGLEAALDAAAKPFVVVGALVTFGKYLHERLIAALRSRARAKAALLLLRRGDPRWIKVLEGASAQAQGA